MDQFYIDTFTVFQQPVLFQEGGTGDGRSGLRYDNRSLVTFGSCFNLLVEGLDQIYSIKSFNFTGKIRKG